MNFDRDVAFPNKIRIIDLLNKIANGEEDDLITEFEFDKRVWNFKALNDSEFCLDGWLLNQNITITKHKEILEEEKKIPEKLDLILDEQFTNDKLQSNWNSLREWLEKENEYSDYRDVFYREHMGYVLDKMNELEGVDNENNRFIK